VAFGYAVYFSERPKNRVVRWDPGSGETRVVAGESGSGDRSQSLNDPYGLAFDLDGNLLISDKLNHRLCRLRNNRLEALELKDTNGHRARGPESPAHFEAGRLSCPTSMFVEKGGAVLCAFYDDHTIYRIHPGGRLELLVGIVPNRPYFFNPPREHVPPEELSSEPIFCPTGLVARSDGMIFFIERQTRVVRSYHPNFGLSSIFSLSQASGWLQKTVAPAYGRLDAYHPVSPTSLALDASGTLFLCDPLHSSVLKLNLEASTFERVVFRPRRRGDCLDGGPIAITFGHDGTAWVADSGSGTIQAYSITPTGEWLPASPRLESVQNQPLQIGGGGMGLLVGA
jgi:hypothetical protein